MNAYLKEIADVCKIHKSLTFHIARHTFATTQKKYQGLNINMVKQSLIHHDDIIFLPVEFIGAEIKWPAISDRLKAAFHNPYITFGLPETTKKLMENLKDNEKKKGRGRRP